MKPFFLFLLIAFLFSCSKDNAGIEQEKFYFKANINGQYIEWNLDKYPDMEVFGSNRNAHAILSSDCENTYCRQYDIGGHIWLDKPVSNSIANMISIYFSQAAKPTEKMDMLQSISPGNLPFGSNRMSIGEDIHNGIVVNYVGSSKSWSSTRRFGDQDGSSFESISLTDAPPGKPYEKIWTGRFSCKLYTLYCPPGTPPEVITITDAQFCLPVYGN